MDSKKKGPCPKCQLNQAAGMNYCNRCGVKIGTYRSRDMIEVMLHPEQYQPGPPVEEASAPVATTAATAAPATRPQLIVMAADRPEDDVPTVEVSNPEADQSTPATAAEPPTAADESATADANIEVDSTFDDDAVTEEVDLKPPIKRRWVTYLVIALAVIACGTLLAILVSALNGPFKKGLNSLKPVQTKKAAPAKTPAEKPAPQPEVSTHAKPATGQLDLSNCGPGSITVQGNKVLLKDCVKVKGPTDPVVRGVTRRLDHAENERVRRQADALRILREVRKAKPDPDGPVIKSWKLDAPPLVITSRRKP